jgi:hypothetical protein
MTPEQLQIFVDTVDLLVVSMQQFSIDGGAIVSFFTGALSGKAMVYGWGRGI